MKKQDSRAAESVANFRAIASGVFNGWTPGWRALDTLREWIKDQTLVYLRATSSRRSAGRTGAASETGATTNIDRQERNSQARGGPKASEFDPDKSRYRRSNSKTAVVGDYPRNERRPTRPDRARRRYRAQSEYVERAEFGAQTLIETTGLVLIDELDLHLHPKWQRQIIGALKRIYPKIQFFATTHSPQVIGQAKPEEIVLLTRTATGAAVPQLRQKFQLGTRMRHARRGARSRQRSGSRRCSRRSNKGVSTTRNAKWRASRTYRRRRPTSRPSTPTSGTWGSMAKRPRSEAHSSKGERAAAPAPLATRKSDTARSLFKTSL